MPMKNWHLEKYVKSDDHGDDKISYTIEEDIYV